MGVELCGNRRAWAICFISQHLFRVLSLWLIVSLVLLWGCSKSSPLDPGDASLDDILTFLSRPVTDAAGNLLAPADVMAVPDPRIGVLIREQTDAVAQIIIQAVMDQAADPETRRRGADALGTLAVEFNLTSQVLVTALGDADNAKTREYLYRGLCRYPLTDNVALEAMATGIELEFGRTRLQCIEYFLQGDYQSRRAEQALSSVLLGPDSSYDERGAASLALARGVNLGSATEAALLSVANDSKGGVRVSVAMALRRVQSPSPATRSALVALAEDAEGYVRAEAQVSLRELEQRRR